MGVNFAMENVILLPVKGDVSPSNPIKYDEARSFGTVHFLPPRFGRLPSSRIAGPRFFPRLNVVGVDDGGDQSRKAFFDF
jgi:hypothetical protein